MWRLLLAHHGPDDEARCIRLGGLSLCRRCTAAWPLAGALILAGLAGHLPAAHDLELALWLGPPTGEYAAVHAAGRPYHPGRTWFFGLLFGIGMGRTLHRYLLDPGDPAVWLVLGTVALTWGAAAAVYQLRS